MKFPGSRLLHQWDLSIHSLSLDDLLRSCRQVGLTGLAELTFPDGVGIIFYYLGVEVNAHFRDRSSAYTAQGALDRLASKVTGEEGAVSVYELPLDMAHLLRGMTNRQKLRDLLHGRVDLVEQLHRLEKAEHTGTLEIQTPSGAGMVLLVRGRASNTYWEAADGLTFEKGEARQKLEEALDRAEAFGFLSEFSREAWKSRQAVPVSIRSRLERRGGAAATDQLAAEEQQLRDRALEELAEQVPALIQAFVFDLMTGGVLSRTGRGSSDIHVGALVEQMPALTIYLRDGVLGGEDENALESFVLQAAQVTVVVTVVPEAQEAMAVMADRSQPSSLIASALTRVARDYAAGRQSIMTRGVRSSP
jgi:hypothetical protein